jgi:hypothetical protein
MIDPKNTEPMNDSIAKTANGASKEAASSPAAYQGQPDDLHDLFAATPDFNGPDEEDPLAALRNDPNYSALIRDLEYIAKQARLLFEPAGEAPSDEVWTKIKRELETGAESDSADA